MTVKELLKTYTKFTRADEDHIYIIPHGRFSYTVYPVGDFQIVDENTEPVFKPFADAIMITPDEYMGIINGTHCFDFINKKVILYVKSEKEELLQNNEKLLLEKTNTVITYLNFLKDTDYVALKIFEAENSTESEYLKKTYSEVLEKRKNYRKAIDPLKIEVENLKNLIANLKEEVNNEN